MKKSDIKDIYMIDKKLCPYPWSQKTFADCIDMDYGCYVLVENKIIIGFGVASVLLDEAHILNIGVVKEMHGLGLGYKMLKHLIKYIKKNPLVKNIFLEVSVKNKKAKKLYETFGFEKIGLRKDYYRITNGREDAIVMRLAIG